jgi:hypothetical protein
MEAQRLLAAAWAGAGAKAAYPDADGDWLVEFARTSASNGVTDSIGASPLYQELARRRRSAGVDV